MKTIAIANQKGGVGKTAVACHLAFHLRDAGHKVLFIDLDPQGNASSTLKASAVPNVDAAALFADDLIELTVRDGITLLGANAALADLERADPKVIGHFREHMTAWSAAFDFAIIDTAPTLGLRMSAALIVADFVLCPIELESYSIQGITNMLQTVFGIRERFNPGLTFLGMLPNRFNAHSNSQKANLDQLIKSYAHLMIAARIGNRSSIPEALGAGVPVWELPKTAAREAAREMKQVFALVESKMEASP